MNEYVHCICGCIYMYLVVCLSRNNAVLVCTYEAYFTVQYTVSIVDEVYTIPIV